MGGRDAPSLTTASVVSMAAAALALAAVACEAPTPTPSALAAGPAPFAAKPATPADDEPLAFSECGRTLLAPSRRVAVGRIRSVVPLPGGPRLARFEIERELKESGDSARSLAVVCGPASLHAGPARVLLFLREPDPGSALWPLHAWATDEDPSFDERVQLVIETLQVAHLDRSDERRVAARMMWMRQAEDDGRWLRHQALRELARHLDDAEVFLRPEDAARLERIAAETTDRAHAAECIALASRVRAPYARHAP
ncbi:MAG TPA: hypothetical protein VKE69_01510 [Planctomycetota bacterium]|nr:hypothetical protein [Planctomycetota bacterium]